MSSYFKNVFNSSQFNSVNIYLELFWAGQNYLSLLGAGLVYKELDITWTLKEPPWPLKHYPAPWGGIGLFKNNSVTKLVK